MHIVGQPISRTLSPYKTETLYPLNNSPFFPPPSPWQSPSTFCLYELDSSRNLIWYLSLCDWLISLTIMSSMFIHVTIHDKFSSFLRECTEIFFADQQKAQVYPNHFRLRYHESKFSSKPSSDSDSQDSSNSVIALASLTPCHSWPKLPNLDPFSTFQIIV